jgi:phospholipase C
MSAYRDIREMSSLNPGVRASTAASTKRAPAERVPGGPTGSYIVPAGIHKVKHVIIIEQENRSFDNYFGTYPGADGIPMKNGKPTVCLPNPATKGCTKPYRDVTDIDGGGPHNEKNAIADVNGGKMNGFIIQRDSGKNSAANCRSALDPACSHAADTIPDVVGYHTAAEVPNY